jgi:chaperone BCS1
LNVLDGVVDTPGRIVILTSNCPTMLDPALIRPGRVDKQLMLGHMEPGDVATMLEHYFQTELTGKQLHRVLAAIGNPSGVKLTPAQVEQMAAEHDDLEDMLHALERKEGLCESTVGVVESDYEADEHGIRI